MRDNRGILQNIDWVTTSLYFILITMGWMCIYAADFNEEHSRVFDFTQNHGKQLMWIGGSIIIALIFLILDGKFYSAFAYLVYGVTIVLLIAVLLVGRKVKGSVSWFEIGSFKLQPAEFAKFATTLVLAKYLSNTNIKLNDNKTKMVVFTILFVPIILIIMQNATGSALVYLSFIFVLYREGLSGNYLLLGFIAIVIFILALLVDKLTLIIIFASIIFILFLLARKNKKNILSLLGVFAICSGMVLSVDYVFNHVLHEYQRGRINVLLGKEQNIKGSGWNVHQSMIAIGDGGFFGKGFLKGSQTTFDFVPKQSTDFIFCTVGEEFGFVGVTVVISLFLFLLIRIIQLAERQRSSFSRIYGYGVASILFFHVMINIGMTIGLAPVIGIPLPFFTYGGSSLLAFTMMLFVFIRLDAYRLQILG